MVPMLTCGLLRSNFAFATAVSSSDCFVCPGLWMRPDLFVPTEDPQTQPVYLRWFSSARLAAGRTATCASAQVADNPLLARRFGDDFLPHALRTFRIRVEHHRVRRPA